VAESDVKQTEADVESGSDLSKMGIFCMSKFGVGGHEIGLITVVGAPKSLMGFHWSGEVVH
jgi:hypothetical protein